MKLQYSTVSYNTIKNNYINYKNRKNKKRYRNKYIGYSESTFIHLIDTFVQCKSKILLNSLFAKCSATWKMLVAEEM